jgi:hypothetical protein
MVDAQREGEPDSAQSTPILRYPWLLSA